MRRTSAETWARAPQFNGFTDIHLKRASVVLGCRDISELIITLDEPERSRNDADADRGVTGFKAL